MQQIVPLTLNAHSQHSDAQYIKLLCKWMIIALGFVHYNSDPLYPSFCEMSVTCNSSHWNFSESDGWLIVLSCAIKVLFALLGHVFQYFVVDYTSFLKYCSVSVRIIPLTLSYGISSWLFTNQHSRNTPPPRPFGIHFSKTSHLSESFVKLVNPMVSIVLRFFFW